MPSDDQILRNLRSHPNYRSRISLSLEGVEEYSHAGLPAFRVVGRKFASLASQAGGYGNLMLTLEQQAVFVEEAPEIFLPIPGGWGGMGHTHIRLASASEDVFTGALQVPTHLANARSVAAIMRSRPGRGGRLPPPANASTQPRATPLCKLTGTPACSSETSLQDNQVMTGPD